MRSAYAGVKGEALKQSFERELRAIIAKKPKYVWGGVDDEKGIDCSGYIWLAAKRAGLSVKRTTAYEMEAGNGNWITVRITELCDAEDGDLVWWTWKANRNKQPSRPHGHVGAFILGPHSKLLEVTHASSGHGHVVCEQVKGALETDISSIKRLRCFR